MLSLHNFFSINRVIIMFIYGSAFFLMGFGIFLKNRHLSRFKLAKSLHWLGLFGIIHGFADWGHVFIPIQQVNYSEQTLLLLRFIQIILNALSFMFLSLFGISLWTDTRSKWYKLKNLPILLFIFWLLCIVALISSNYNKSTLDWIRIGDIYSRYLIGFPSSLLSAYAIILQKGQFTKLGFVKYLNFLRFAAISLVIYGFSSGLIVPKDLAGLPKILNDDLFFHTTGLPIELVRAFAGFLLAILIFKVSQVFDQEYINRLQESEITKIRFQERNRLAQDLHDDIIQSLYATNLELEVIKHLLDKRPQEASERLSRFLLNRNKIIEQIREYIGDLKRVNEENICLQKRIENLLNEFKIYEKLNVNFEFAYYGKQLSLTTIYHLTLILKEAITNVIKHAQAKNLMLKIYNTSDQLLFEITDDGIGFSKDTAKNNHSPVLQQGLQNIKARVKIMHGSVEIKSNLNEGTGIFISVPLNGGLYDKVDDC